MIAKAIESLADRVLTYDEADLTKLLNHFKDRMEQLEPTDEWERAVIAYFMINGVRVKNALKHGKMCHPERGVRPALRLVKNS
ncbi:MAG: hypothetical protein FJ126_03325 [Deltaproteobacteria bacterium]|nr:hypothetical protein [Deltaproteobacteria bacterium]